MKKCMLAFAMLLSGCGNYIPDYSNGPYPTGTCFSFTETTVAKSRGYYGPDNKYAFVIYVDTDKLTPVACPTQ